MFYALPIYLCTAIQSIRHDNAIVSSDFGNFDRLEENKNKWKFLY